MTAYSNGEILRDAQNDRQKANDKGNDEILRYAQNDNNTARYFVAGAPQNDSKGQELICRGTKEAKVLQPL